MTIAVSITETNVFKTLRSFLLSVLPVGIDVIRAQVNRVPEPSSPDFVIVNSTMRTRLATNIDTYADALFVGSISYDTLDITSVDYGALTIGATVFMPNLPLGTVVTAFGTGTGGIGTYTISPPFSQQLTDQAGNPLTDQAGNLIVQTTLPSGPVAAGNAFFLQKTQFNMQIDVHGPNGGDNAQIITTMMRDDYAVQQFATSGLAITPLYADDPRQIPFINAEQQYENRWVVEAMLQVDPVITVPQQFADQLNVTLINVAATYPA